MAQAWLAGRYAIAPAKPCDLRKRPGESRRRPRVRWQRRWLIQAVLEAGFVALAIRWNACRDGLRFSEMGFAIERGMDCRAGLRAEAARGAAGRAANGAFLKKRRAALAF